MNGISAQEQSRIDHGCSPTLSMHRKGHALIYTADFLEELRGEAINISTEMHGSSAIPCRESLTQCKHKRMDEDVNRGEA